MCRNFIRQTRVIFLDELKQSFRNKKFIIALAIYLFLTYFLIKNGTNIATVIKLFWLVSDYSAPILVYYLSSLLLIPLFAILISHDSISSETQENAIRYIASRASRYSIFFGKLLADMAIITAINLLIAAAMLYYNYNYTGLYAFKELSISFFYLTLYAFVFAGIGIFSSVVLRRTTMALWLSMLISVSFLFLHLKDSFNIFSPYHYILAPIKGTLSAGIIAYVSFAAVFIAAAFIIFKRKDL
jgi:ABC-type transport system involved in multi-copper enzyme maturation permease subunit